MLTSFYLLILLELRVPKIRDTLSYLTLLVCLVLFNFQGPISLPPREAALLLYHTLFSLSSSFLRSFSSLSESFSSLTHPVRFVNYFFLLFFFFFAVSSVSLSTACLSYHIPSLLSTPFLNYFLFFSFLKYTMFFDILYSTFISNLFH